MELQYPSSLYKFYSFSMLSLKAMNNDSLWFAKPDSFNDPYDCAITAKIEKKEYIDAITAAMNSSSPKDELSKVWPGDKDVLEQCHKKWMQY